jgi:hypothetical protein
MHVFSIYTSLTLYKYYETLYSTQEFLIIIVSDDGEYLTLTAHICLTMGDSFSEWRKQTHLPFAN